MCSQDVLEEKYGIAFRRVRGDHTITIYIKTRVVICVVFSEIIRGLEQRVDVVCIDHSVAIYVSTVHFCTNGVFGRVIDGSPGRFTKTPGFKVST